eukprot:TRINITY_DN66657_c8_g1_i1.p1 TRINITY_DN66657_c8_g1~~TRINITY_DN66657_c8_g1_i1.p1  ORF type:complete len:106 (+),score=2.85 TRINITY_DN66657_c8_g1_i1:316-633(+)
MISACLYSEAAFLYCHCAVEETETIAVQPLLAHSGRWTGNAARKFFKKSEEIIGGLAPCAAPHSRSSSSFQDAFSVASCALVPDLALLHGGVGPSLHANSCVPCG